MMDEESKDQKAIADLIEIVEALALFCIVHRVKDIHIPDDEREWFDQATSDIVKWLEAVKI